LAEVWEDVPQKLLVEQKCKTGYGI